MDVDLLHRLTGQRGWDADTITRIAGSDITAPEALRRLAPELGWHAADLFVLVRCELPADLWPTDPKADPGRIAWDYAALPPARSILLAAARAMPQQPVVGPMPPPRRPFPEDKPGGIIGRLLYHRNFSITSAAPLLLFSGGPYLSASTVNMIGLGGKALDPQLVTGFARLLGIPVGDLGALCGIEMTEDLPAPDYADGLAALMWEGRRLTCEQIQELDALGHDLRHKFGSELPDGVRCHCARARPSAPKQRN